MSVPNKTVKQNPESVDPPQISLLARDQVSGQTGDFIELVADTLIATQPIETGASAPEHTKMTPTKRSRNPRKPEVKNMQNHRHPAPDKPWRTFGITAVCAIVLIATLLLVTPGGKPILMILALGAVSITFGTIAAVVCVALSSRGSLNVDLSTRFGKITASGAIAAFLLVAYFSYKLLSQDIHVSNSYDLDRQSIAIEKINEMFAATRTALPPGLTGAPPQPEVDQIINDIETEIAILEAKQDTASEFGRRLQQKKDMIVYYRATVKLLRDQPSEALQIIGGRTGEVLPRANLDLIRARAHMLLGEWDPAMKSIILVRAIYPRDACLRFSEAICLFHMRKFSLAHQAFAAATSGVAELVNVSDGRLMYASALLGKLVAFRHAQDADPRGIANYKELDADLRQVVGLYENLLATKNPSDSEKVVWKRSIAAAHRYAGDIESNTDQRLRHYDAALTILRSLIPGDEPARVELALTLIGRCDANRLTKNLQDAFRDSHEAAEILDASEHLPGKRAIDPEILASAHINAGECAMALPANNRATAEIHLGRVVELIGNAKPAIEQLTVLASRARSALAIVSLKAGRKADARKLAEQIEKDLRSLEAKRANDSDVVNALLIARKLLAAIPAPAQ